MALVSSHVKKPKKALGAAICWALLSPCVCPAASVETTAPVIAGLGACTGGTCQCDDGIDNDDDGLTDWGEDLGCTALDDDSEGGLATGAIENSFTVHEPSTTTTVTFVATNGSDGNACGAGQAAPKATIANAVDCLVDGEADWLLLRAGDDFEPQILNFGDRSGLAADQPIVVGAYYPGNNAGLAPPRIGRILYEGDNIHILGLDWGNHNHGMQGSQRDLLLEGNRQENVDTGFGDPAIYVVGHNPAVRHHVFWRAVGSTIFEAHITGGSRYEHNFWYQASTGGGHALYGTRGTKAPGIGSFRYNWATDDRTIGNGLMIRYGGETYRNVFQNMGWNAITLGGCSDNGNSGVCGVAPCAACIPWSSASDTFHQDCRSAGTVAVSLDQVTGGAITNTCDHNCANGNGNVPAGTTGGVTSEPIQTSAVGLEEYHLSLGGDGTSLGWWTDLRAAKSWRNTPPEYLANAFFDYLETASDCSFGGFLPIFSDGFESGNLGAWSTTQL